jgi:hypothetical protein
MDVARAAPVLRAHRSNEHLPQQSTPVKAKNAVSVAAIFKQQPQKTKKQPITSHMPIANPKKTVHYYSDNKAPSLKSRSSSRTPQKIRRKVSRKRPGVHPLAVEFKGMLRL